MTGRLTAQFPNFDEKLRRRHEERDRAFLPDLIKEDRSVLELLDADYTYVNERLAKHYGIPDIKGDDFSSVSLAGTNARRRPDHGQRPDGHCHALAHQPREGGKFILQQSSAHLLRLLPPKSPLFPISATMPRPRPFASGWRSIGATPTAPSAISAWTPSALPWKTSTPSAPCATKDRRPCHRHLR